MYVALNLANYIHELRTRHVAEHLMTKYLGWMLPLTSFTV